MADFKLTPALEKELEKIAKSLPEKDFKDKYGDRWMEVKMATAMNILKRKHGYKTEEKMKFKELSEKYRSKFSSSLVAKAVEIALSMGGNMTGAYKKIEALKKGLGDDPIVKSALKTANEEVVAEGKLDEKKNYKYSKNFFTNDKNDKLKNISDRDGYGEIELGHYLAQKAGLKNPDNLYFDDDKLVYGSKTIARGAYDKSVSQLLDVVKKIKEEVNESKASRLAIREKELNLKIKELKLRALMKAAEESDEEKKVEKKESTKSFKELRNELEEAKKAGRGKVTLDIDYIGDRSDIQQAEKKYKIKIKMRGRQMADVSGDKQNLYNFLKGPDYGMDEVDIEDLFPELFESKIK